MQVSKLNRFILGHLNLHLFQTRSKHMERIIQIKSVCMVRMEIEVYSEPWKTKKKNHMFFKNVKKQNWQHHKKGFFQKYLDLPKLC